jgi:type II secretory pathway pseudopilin PulG
MGAERTLTACGFLLIEVLIALAIVGLVVACVAQTLVGGLLLAGRAQREGQASEIASSALATAVATGGGHLVEQRDLDGGFVRRVTIRPRPDLVLPASDPMLTPYQIDVVVTWHEGRVGRSLALSSLRLGTSQ